MSRSSLLGDQVTEIITAVRFRLGQRATLVLFLFYLSPKSVGWHLGHQTSTALGLLRLQAKIQPGTAGREHAKTTRASEHAEFEAGQQRGG